MIEEQHLSKRSTSIRDSWVWTQLKRFTGRFECTLPSYTHSCVFHWCACCLQSSKTIYPFEDVGTKKSRFPRGDWRVMTTDVGLEDVALMKMMSIAYRRVSEVHTFLSYHTYSPLEASSRRTKKMISTTRLALSLIGNVQRY